MTFLFLCGFGLYCCRFDNCCSRTVVALSKIFTIIQNYVRPDDRCGVVVAPNEAQLMRVECNDVSIVRPAPELNAILLINLRLCTAWKGIKRIDSGHVAGNMLCACGA
jgi:hypothetical protein